MHMKLGRKKQKTKNPVLHPAEFDKLATRDFCPAHWESVKGKGRIRLFLAPFISTQSTAQKCHLLGREEDLLKRTGLLCRIVLYDRANEPAAVSPAPALHIPISATVNVLISSLPPPPFPNYFYSCSKTGGFARRWTAPPRDGNQAVTSAEADESCGPAGERPEGHGQRRSGAASRGLRGHPGPPRRSPQSS